jgi:EipB-like
MVDQPRAPPAIGLRQLEHLMRATRLALLILAFSSGAFPASAAVRALAPHRAVYDLTLDKASDRSGITGITGRMVYEFNGSACEGYTVTFRFVTRINTGESTRVTDQQTTTFEDAGGKNFSFVTKSYVDQSLDKEVRGTATREGNTVKVQLEKPDQQSVDLGHTLFPTQHLIDLLDKADVGNTFYETSLFDGSEDADRAMTTNVVIGKKADGGKDDPEAPALASLEKEKVWPVEIAYFDPKKGGGEETPEYRISFKLHDNGVTRDLIMDYGDFSMKGTLVNLKLFDAKPQTCN